MSALKNSPSARPAKPVHASDDDSPSDAGCFEERLRTSSSDQDVASPFALLQVVSKLPLYSRCEIVGYGATTAARSPTRVLLIHASELGWHPSPDDHAQFMLMPDAALVYGSNAMTLVCHDPPPLIDWSFRG